MTDELRQLIERLGDLTDDELTNLIDGLASAAEEVAESDTDDALTDLQTIHDGLQEARAEKQTRDDAAAERAAKREELLGGIRGSDDDGGDAEVTDEPAEDTEPAEPVAASTDTEPTPEPTPAVEEPATEPVAAAAEPTPLPMPASTSQPKGEDRTLNINVAVTAGGDLRDHTAGTRFESLRDIGEAFANRAESTRGHRGNARHTVASMRADFPNDRVLDSDAISNTEKLNAVCSPEAVVATGGVCAPAQARYDIPGVSVTRRPLKDSLPQFQVPRGKMAFIPAPGISAINTSTGVGIKLEADDASGGASADKTCQTISCPSETEVTTQAVFQCLQFGNFDRLTFPEHFSRIWAEASAAHARLAEGDLFDRMCTAAPLAHTTGQVLGAARDVLENVIQAAAVMRNQERTEADVTLEVAKPAWVRDLMLADLMRTMPGDNHLAEAVNDIDAKLAAKNVRVTWVLDGQDFGASVDGQPLPAWPGNYQWLIYPAGSYAFLDTGRLDFGTEIRDSVLNSTNDVQAFMEDFEEVAFIGPAAFCLTSDVCPIGTSAGTVDTTSICATGS